MKQLTVWYRANINKLYLQWKGACKQLLQLWMNKLLELKWCQAKISIKLENKLSKLSPY
jgi:hypothetical protein